MAKRALLAAMSGGFSRDLRYNFFMRASFSLSAFGILALCLTALAAGTAHAQRVVDPSTVAPEFREAAEKRRAEQLKQILCNKMAHDQKIAPRDMLKFVSDCFDKPNDKSTDISASRPTAPDAARANSTQATPK